LENDENQRRTIFVSRAGADQAVALEVGRVLEDLGYVVVLQDWDFRGANFVDSVHAGLKAASHVVALLSPAYMASDNCSAEWQNAIAGDPLNKLGRLVVLRVAECTPVGLLAGIAYWDLVPFLGDPVGLAERVRSAFESTGRGRDGTRPPERADATRRVGGMESSPQNNLPLQANRLVGRELLVEEIRRIREGHRIVTLVGTGGVGKTRVALQVATESLEALGTDAWFVDLAPVSDPSFVAGTLAATVGVPQSSPSSTLERLVQYLSPRRMLLVLDNCEHVVAEAARVAAEIIRTCPRISIIATSREALGIGAEKVVRVPPLALPSAGAPVTRETVLAYGAVEWFVERARLVDSSFTLTDANAPIIVDICRRVDGIPYMIELIAARVTVLAVSELAGRMRQRFPMSEGAGREALPRRRTLRALIDWSHNLLNEPQQLLFRRLATFVGGCSLGAAEAVVSDEVVDSFDVLDLLSSLVDKSLVVADVREDGTRYRFLETTRAYALEKLAASGEASRLSGRHAAWVASFADAQAASSWITPDSRLLPRILPDIENIRTALHWVLDVEPDGETAGRIAGGLTVLWQGRLLGEGRRYLERCLREYRPAHPSKIEAILSLGLAATSVARARVEAARRAVTAFEALGDLAGLADGLRYLADGLRQMQDLEEAGETARRSLKLFEAIGREGSSKYAALLTTYASILVDDGQSARARDVYDLALARYDKLGDAPAEARVRTQVAELEFDAGNLSLALALARPATAKFAELGDVVAQALTTCNIAAYLLAAGRTIEAHATAVEAVKLAISVDNALFLAFSLQHVGTAVATAGDVKLGARLLNYVDRWFETEGFEREFTEKQAYDLGVAAVREALPEEEASALLCSTTPVTAEDAIAQALASTVDLAVPNRS
jgi:predicted ATPase